MSKVAIADIVRAAGELRDAQKRVSGPRIAEKVGTTSAQIAKMFRQIPWLRDKVPLYGASRAACNRVSSEKYAAVASQMMQVGVRVTIKRLAHLMDSDQHTVQSYMYRHPELAESWGLVSEHVHRHALRATRLRWILVCAAPRQLYLHELAEIIGMKPDSLRRWLLMNHDIRMHLGPAVRSDVPIACRLSEEECHDRDL